MTRLTEKQLNQRVTITCYRKKQVMTRRKAIAYYEEGMMCCDPGSSECGRYTRIYLQLLDGYMQCSDQD